MPDGLSGGAFSFRLKRAAPKSGDSLRPEFEFFPLGEVSVGFSPYWDNLRGPPGSTRWGSTKSDIRGLLWEPVRCGRTPVLAWLERIMRALP